MTQQNILLNEWENKKPKSKPKNKNTILKINDEVIFKNQLDDKHKGIFIIEKTYTIYGIRFYNLKNYNWNIDSNMLTLKESVINE